MHPSRIYESFVNEGIRSVATQYTHFHEFILKKSTNAVFIFFIFPNSNSGTRMFLVRRLSHSQKKTSSEQADRLKKIDCQDSKSLIHLPIPEGKKLQPPVRLLIVDQFVSLTEVPFYEILPRHIYIEVDYEEYLINYCKKTAAISWRWKSPKPQTRADAEAKLQSDNPVPRNLLSFVLEKVKVHPEIEYVWLDWCCAPQYPTGDVEATMREINRSGKYYSTSKEIFIWCFNQLDGDFFEYSDYFNRAWTLSERLHRYQSSCPLTGANFVPVCLTSVLKNRKHLPLKTGDCTSKTWGVLIAKALAKLQLSSTEGGGITSEALLSFVKETLASRYPLILIGLEALEGDKGSLTKVLNPSVLALLSAILRLLAIIDWVRNPDLVVDDMTQVLGLVPFSFKGALIKATIQQTRMTLNNQQSSSDLAEAFNELGEIEDGFRHENTFQESLERLDAKIEFLWDLALNEKIAEKPTKMWLRRYLTSEIASYQSLELDDKLFSVYKLFPECQENRTYEEVELLWKDLCKAAGLNNFLKGTHGWIQELSLINGVGEDDTIQYTNFKFFAQNKRRKMKHSSIHPQNFGVYGFPPFSRSLNLKAIIFDDDIFPCNEPIVTYLLGFNFDEKVCALLGQKADFTLVDKSSGGEIEEHLSLRGRKALYKFEALMHEGIRTSFNFKVDNKPYMMKANNGLFICVRYHGANNLSRCIILRTCSYVENRWTLESIFGFTSEPMKGSSWGISKVLDNIISDLKDIDSDLPFIPFLSKEQGTCAPFSELTKLELGSNAGDEEECFLNWLFDDENQARARTTFHESLLTNKKEILIDLEDLNVFGKTTFEATTEFNRIQKSFQRILSFGMNSETLGTYYNLLQRNYVHDSVMARNLTYFGDLCEILVVHLQKEPGILNDPLIRQSFDYLSEDMYDALDIAAENRETPLVIEKARHALDKLKAVLEG